MRLSSGRQEITRAALQGAGVFMETCSPKNNPLPLRQETPGKAHNVGALVIRIGCWDMLNCNFNKEPQNSLGKYLGPYITPLGASEVARLNKTYTQKCMSIKTFIKSRSPKQLLNPKPHTCHTLNFETQSNCCGCQIFEEGPSAPASRAR